MTHKPIFPGASAPGAALRTVIEAMSTASPASRAQIAAATGLPTQDISTCLRALQRQGWLKLGRTARGGPGRGTASHAIRKDAAYLFACDIGGTKLHVALADLSGDIVAEALEETDQRSGRHLLSQIRSIADGLVRKTRIGRDRVATGAVGLAGVVDRETGRLTFGPNIPGFGSANVIDGMRRAFGCHVAIENDVNLAALGEHWRGRGRGVANLAFIALGTGIGMGLLTDGRLMRGAHGAASEIAYLPIGADPFDPRNVAAGTFESVVGTEGILRRHRAAGGRVTDGVRGIFAALRKGDPIARKTIDETARWTAIGIAAIVALCDPELIILGGGIGPRPEFIAQVEDHLARCLLRPMPVAPSPLENRASLLGAISLGLDHLCARAAGEGRAVDAHAKNPAAA